MKETEFSIFSSTHTFNDPLDSEILSNSLCLFLLDISSTPTTIMRQTSLIPNALGAVGTLCWCANLLPQIWYNYQRKSTEGLPVLTIFLYGASGVPSGAYYITKNFNLALVLQPHLFSLLYGLAWAQCLIYEKLVSYRKLKFVLTRIGSGEYGRSQP